MERTFLFARDISDYVDKLPKKITNIEIGGQLVRSGGSVGANYIEADKSFSKNEAKKSKYLLNLSIPT